MFTRTFFLAVAISCIAGTATALSSSDAAAKPIPLSGAGATCDNWQVVPNTADLEASCEQDNGAFVETRISISQCAGNQNGNIACQAGGGAGGSCIFSNIQASLGNPTVAIEASCLNDAQQRVDQIFDIGACLTNRNGQLTC